jgi:LacI family transcriptional regulator
MTAKTTIRDVAKEAGVSISMVSRALSGRGYVAKATAERIREVVSRLGYYPSPLARGMRDRGTQTLGILFGWQPENLVRNFYTGEILAGVFDASVQSGYQILVNDIMSPTENWEEGPECQRILNDTRVEGLLLVAPPPLLVQAFRHAPYSVVLVNHQDPDYHFVDAEQAGAVEHLTRHFAAKGHRRIGFLGGDDFDSAAGIRYRAFAEARASLGLKEEDCPVYRGSFRRESGASGARELMSRPNPPSAIVASTDLMAMGALEALRGSAKLPEIAGIDGHPEGERFQPSFSTMRQPIFEMARLATEFLIKSKGQAQESFQVKLPMEFVDREKA